jgi:hypothetical protein
MKTIFRISILSLFVFILHPASRAQCVDFVQTRGYNQLNTQVFVPEGRYDAMILSEGDYLNVYKSFFRGKTYKVVVIAENNIPKINFQIKTMQGEIIYDNSANENSNFWEYTSDKNQNLMICVELPKVNTGIPKSGCIAVLMGYKIKI